MSSCMGANDTTPFQQAPPDASFADCTVFLTSIRSAWYDQNSVSALGKPTNGGTLLKGSL